MTAQVTWSGRVSVFEVKLYLQDLIEKNRVKNKNGLHNKFSFARQRPRGENMLDGPHGDNDD